MIDLTKLVPRLDYVGICADTPPEVGCSSVEAAAATGIFNISPVVRDLEREALVRVHVIIVKFTVRIRYDRRQGSCHYQ